MTDKPPARPLRSGQTCPAGHDVATGMLFCTECGLQMGTTPLPWTCAKGHASNATAKFCGVCGQPRPWPEAASMVAAMLEPPRYSRPGSEPDGAQVIHFVEDGFDFGGVIWLKGQELVLVPGTPRWAEAQRWISLDTESQRRRFGKVYFARGRYPGKRPETVPRLVPGG